MSEQKLPLDTLTEDEVRSIKRILKLISAVADKYSSKKEESWIKRHKELWFPIVSGVILVIVGSFLQVVNAGYEEKLILANEFYKNKWDLYTELAENYVQMLEGANNSYSKFVNSMIKVHGLFRSKKVACAIYQLDKIMDCRGDDAGEQKTALYERPRGCDEIICQETWKNDENVVTKNAIVLLEAMRNEVYESID